MKYDFDMTVDEHTSLGKIVAQISPEAEVLEFGPGNGRMTNYLMTEKKCQVSIVEFDEELYNFVMQFATDGFLGNIEEYLWLDYYKAKKFDVIVFADVLEHLVDPEKALVKAKALLKPEGRILITFPNLAHNSVLIGLFNNELDWKEFGLLDHTHNTFYTQHGFEQLFQRIGLSIAIEDFTYSQVGQNEIDTTYEQLPKKVQYSFKSRPFGEVYQYFYALSLHEIEYPLRNKPQNSHFVKHVQFAYNKEGKLSIKPLLYNQFTGENQQSVHQIDQSVESLKIVPFEGSGIIQFYASVNDQKIQPIQTNAIWSNHDKYIFTGIDENPFFLFDGEQIAGKELVVFFDIVSENEFSEDEKSVMQYSVRQAKEIQTLTHQRAKDKVAFKEERDFQIENTYALLSKSHVQTGLQKLAKQSRKEFQLYDEKKIRNIKMTVETIENNPDNQTAIIKGWGFDTKSLQPLTYKLPLFEGLYYKTTRLYRKDVNEMFSLEEKGRYGFIIEIEHKQIEKQVGLIVSTIDGDISQLKFNRNNLNNTPIIKRTRYILGMIRSQGLLTTLQRRRERALQEDAYTRWIKEHEQFQPEKIAEEIKSFTTQPKISLVVPVYNVEKKWLDACIESLINQYYQNWELCLADDASTNPEIRPLIEMYLEKDCRIKAVFRPKNGHISEATNSAIAIATGEYIGFLDNDDELAPHALYEIVKAINEDSQRDFIYTDEDKKAISGKRFDPFFKPNWNEELLLGHNYITHFVVVSRGIIEQIGGLRSEYNGSQDYDFVLRATEAAQNIHHIPSICYHWRTVETSVAFDPASKEYAYVAGKEAIASALKRRKLVGNVTMTKNYGAYKVDYVYPEQPLISIIPLGQFNRISLWVADLLENTLYANFELVLPKKYQETYPTSDKRITFVEGETITELIKGATGEVLVFMNEWLSPKKATWLKELLNYLLKPYVGLVTGKIVNPSYEVLNEGITIDRLRKRVSYDDAGVNEQSIGYYFRSVLPREIYSITFDFFAMKSEDCLTLLKDFEGDMNQWKGAMLSQDVFRKINKKVIFTPYSEMIWINKQENPFEMIEWHEAYMGIDDPYSNPNSLE